MDTARRLEVAYTLLPPPLAALPAKYWTPISILVHSYSVATLFQELVDAYARTREAGDAPSSEDAFIIGFIHDFGQKLGLTGRKLENAEEWVAGRLQELGYGERDARFFAKYVKTNPAETRSDPSYPKWVWQLLWLADRLQGVSNVADTVQVVQEASANLEVKISVNIYDVVSPHPLLRSMMAKALHGFLMGLVREEPGRFLVPVGTSSGVIVLADEPLGEITFTWDEIRYGVEGQSILPEGEAKNVVEAINYCQGEGEKPKGLKYRDKYCKHRFGKQNLSAYETLILYYGPKEYLQQLGKEKELKKADLVGKRPLLPSSFREKLIGIKIEGVEYDNGNIICPLCGTSTPHGVYISMVSDYLGEDVAKEKWSRRYPPVNLNRLLNQPGSGSGAFLACPLCLGEAVLFSRLLSNAPVAKRQGRGRRQEVLRILFTLTLQAVMPITAMEDLGKLFGALLDTAYDKVLNPDTALNDLLEYSVVEGNVASRSATLAFDPFTSSIYGVTTIWGEKIEQIVRITALSGLLASWGLYPLVASESPPTAPTRKLLQSIKGQQTLFDYDPSDKVLGRYTPYVALLMLGLGHLYYRKYIVEESVPAVKEVLDYPPSHAPHLLQYAAPRLYSRLETLRLRLEGGEGVV